LTLPGRHVFPGRGGAILVAGLALVAVASGAHEPAKSKAPAAAGAPVGTAPTCHAWVAATHRANEKAGAKASREVTIKALAQACSAIPEQVRRAAGQIQGMKDPAERAAILGEAVSAVLGEGCLFTDPLANALTVSRNCPLPPLPSTFRYRLEEGELLRLGAVDYLIINLMLRNLRAGNQLDESAQYLILEFTLSAQLARDDYLKRAERRQRRPR
jgi:hypothetical protein